MTLPVDPELFAAFLAITALVVVTPGPAILFALAAGVAHGRKAVLLATAGMISGNLVWFAAAALGLAAVAKSHPGAFQWLRWLGVGYLLWLAVGKFAAAFRDPSGAAVAGRRVERPFRDGLLVQLTNPKALVYITAILPPFIEPSRPVGPQLAVFAAAAVALDGLGMITYGFGGAALAARMTEPRFRRLFSAFTGVLLTLAAILILTQH
ncbi:MAG TPA: LysE family translocator [Caulobacteraceae bacterium]|jgi:threonine/homoserine/homoserine lactone efflux protein